MRNKILRRNLFIFCSITLIALILYSLNGYFKNIQFKKYKTNLSIYGEVQCLYTNGDIKKDLIWNLPVDSIVTMEIDNANSMLFLGRFSKIINLEISLKKRENIQFSNEDKYFYVSCKDTLLNNQFYRYIDSVYDIKSLFIEENEHESVKTKQIFKYLLDSSLVKKQINNLRYVGVYLDTAKYNITFNSEEWSGLKEVSLILPKSIYDCNINFSGNFNELKKLEIIDDNSLSDHKKIFNVKAVFPRLEKIYLYGVFIDENLKFIKGNDNYMHTSDSLRQLNCYLKSKEEKINFDVPKSKNIKYIHIQSSRYHNEPIIVNLELLNNLPNIEELVIYSSINDIHSLQLDSLHKLKVLKIIDFTKVELDENFETWNKNLKELRLYNDLIKLPQSITSLDSLKILDLSFSKSPKELGNISNFSSLKEIRVTFKNFDDAFKFILYAKNLKLKKIEIGIDSNTPYGVFIDKKSELENYITNSFKEVDISIENKKLGYFLLNLSKR